MKKQETKYFDLR